MAVAIELEFDVSERSIADFIKAISKFQQKTQRSARDALRSGVIDMLKSTRLRTRKSPKMVARGDVRWGESDPKYYTGEKDKILRRRVIIKRWQGGRQVNVVKWIEVETAFRRRMGMKNGNYQGIVRRVEKTPAMLTKARRRWGRIGRWGLAKKSWGWFMKALFGQAVQDSNPKAQVQPGRMVEGGIKEWRETLPDGSIDLQSPIRCEVDLVNKLDYIRKAMPAGTLALAVQKATNKILHKIKIPNLD